VGSWWSGRRRDTSERLGPRIAYVFDEDVNIYHDERVTWAIAIPALRIPIHANSPERAIAATINSLDRIIARTPVRLSLKGAQARK
jgi:hypothetical protein